MVTEEELGRKVTVYPKLSSVPDIGSVHPLIKFSGLRSSLVTVSAVVMSMGDCLLPNWCWPCSLAEECNRELWTGSERQQQQQFTFLPALNKQKNRVQNVTCLRLLK